MNIFNIYKIQRKDDQDLRSTTWKKEKGIAQIQPNKNTTSHPAQMVTHDLQGLLEDLLSTNLTETLHRESLLAVLRRIAISQNGSKRAVI